MILYNFIADKEVKMSNQTPKTMKTLEKQAIKEFLEPIRAIIFTEYPFTVGETDYLITYQGVGFCIVKRAGRGNHQEFRINF